ncbi:MAG: hypothetical protein K0R27_747 [Xanthobacteraceae bacterium]|jgi:hypothetical protein|nr:hypothetical protein [Xanthobacteraceae bacterium]
MPDGVIFIPLSQTLYRDIIRFSDGRIRPEHVVDDLVRDWIANSIEFGDGSQWGERIDEVAEHYAPHVHARWQEEDRKAVLGASLGSRPLVWKEISVPAGSDVRMAYGQTHHYAKVKGGKIVDADGEFSPSEWASKIAGGTSRNAWRDLWFKEPHSPQWKPAQLLRDQNGAANEQV